VSWRLEPNQTNAEKCGSSFICVVCNLRGAAVFVTVDRSLAVLGILVEDKEDDSVAAVAAHRLCVAGRAARVPAQHQPAV
jgi:hypothetical protein